MPRRPSSKVLSVLAAAALVLAASSCSRLRPEPEPIWESIGTWPDGLRKWLRVRGGPSAWSWSGPDSAAGTAELQIDGNTYRWSFDAAPPAGEVRLTPRSRHWLTIRVPSSDDLASTPPLPHIPCDSKEFGGLVELLRWLITPRFEGRVVHWPDRPIPVRAAPAVSGGLDLAACLREAVTIWAEGASPFVWDDSATWGIRLAHYAGSTRSPPMEFRITRRDAGGRPVRGRIAVGDDYGADERIYALRALCHELAHAALLWGHSPDRGHLLWGSAPPLRASPSADERRAVELLHLLPEGLDLQRYGRANDPGR